MASQVSQSAPTRVRYVVLLLTVGAYLITYLDRTLLSAAAPSIQKEFGFSLQTLGWVLASYQFAYALFQIPGGWLGDKFGPRIALTCVVVWWSAFTAFTTLTWSVASLAVVLFLFGIGEAGAFPIATRSLSCWILPSERGLAQGSTHAGSRFGGAVTPVFAAFLIGHYGWRFPFLVFAIPGLIWAAIWFWYYRDVPAEHKGVNKAERELIESALGTAQRSARQIPWRAILSSPRTWLLCAMYFCYGVIVIIFITWFPKYLSAARALNLQQMGTYASLPLAAAVVGDICGGWFSDLLLKHTGKITFARRTVAATGFFLAGITIPIAVLVADPVTSILFFSLALFAIELTVGNSWAVTLDIGGSYAGSLSAVMSMFGNIGGGVYAVLMGYIVAAFGWQIAFFGLASFAILGGILFCCMDISRPLHAPETVGQNPA
jgi:sugar phosphate permease